MRNILFKKLKDEKGQNLVEFALIVGLLLVIFFGITEFGRAWWRADTLKNAANTAARTYAVTAGNKKAAALKNATGIVGHSSGFSFYTSGGSIKVTVSEDFKSIVSGMPVVGGTTFPIIGNITLRRDATYRLEQ